MLWLEIVKAIAPIASSYIAFLTYKMNKQERERKRMNELSDNEKNASLPPRRNKRSRR